jgi:putative Mn2+ efflux pump MntP
VVALLLVALALGLSNFAASIGIGITGLGAGTRLRVGIVFAVFETGMPIVGLLLGRGLAHVLGEGARWLGGALLIVTGCYAVLQARGSHVAHQGADQVPAGPSTGRLLITGTALSIDNLAVGFALGTRHVSLALAVLLIGGVSVALSLAGLELGGRLGARAGDRGELLGGLVLIGVGVAISAGAL